MEELIHLVREDWRLATDRRAPSREKRHRKYELVIVSAAGVQPRRLD